MITKVFRGVVHGNTIELADNIGLADGEVIEVTVRTIGPPKPPSGEGLLRTEGALANDSEWDAVMEEIQQARRLGRRIDSEEE